MTESNYPEPIFQLINLGAPDRQWPDYPAKFSFTREHIPDLIRLMEDEELRFGEPTPEEEEFLDARIENELPRWYAQIHAWRVLAQLKAEEAIPNFIGLLYQVDEYDDDWVDELINVFAMIGAPCIPHLAIYLQNAGNSDHTRNLTIEAVEKIGKAFPAARDEAVAALIPALENHLNNDEGTNGFLISALVDLKATQHIDLIKEVYDTENVDLFIIGDFEDAQIEMGLLKDRITPRKFRLVTTRDMEKMQKEAINKETIKAKKEKNKRKQEKISRKKNRKKK